MSDINTVIQDMKQGFRRVEQNEATFRSRKRKLMDAYYQQILDDKKLKYYGEIKWQQEQGSKSSSVKQMTDRI